MEWFSFHISSSDDAQPCEGFRVVYLVTYGPNMVTYFITPSSNSQTHFLPCIYNATTIDLYLLYVFIREFCQRLPYKVPCTERRANADHQHDRLAPAIVIKSVTFIARTLRTLKLFVKIVESSNPSNWKYHQTWPLKLFFHIGQATYCSS